MAVRLEVCNGEIGCMSVLLQCGSMTKVFVRVISEY